ncbi:MAG TPA: hypothetical protein VE643_04530 [Nitrososphaeraceae archaeon]|nr:hypothetical protein [Nitrososphaeraceae archaeon]
MGNKDVFPSKSTYYVSGYRVGVIHADEDIQKFNDNKLSGIDAAGQNKMSA